MSLRSPRSVLVAVLAVAVPLATACGGHGRRGGGGDDDDHADGGGGDGDSDGDSDGGPDVCRDTLCGDECVDLFRNATHCGDCETVCASGLGAGGACVSVPDGDACANPLELDTGVYTDFDLVGMSLDHYGAVCLSGVPDADMAFVWMAPSSGTYEIYVSSSRSDHVDVGVYGSECSDAALIACDAGSGAVFLDFGAAAGESYFIVVSSVVGEPYPGTFTIQARRLN